MSVESVNKVKFIAVGFQKREPIQSGLVERIQSVIARALLYIASFFSQSARNLLNAVKADEALRAFEKMDMPEHKTLMQFYRSISPVAKHFLGPDDSYDPEYINLSLQGLTWWGSPSLESDVRRLGFETHKVNAYKSLQDAEKSRENLKKTIPSTEDLSQVQVRVHKNLLNLRDELQKRVSSVWNLVFPGKDYEMRKNIVALDTFTLAGIFRPEPAPQ